MQKRPKIFETFNLVLFGVRTSYSATLGLISILPANTDASPPKDLDKLDNVLEEDSKKV
jgi:hypothetical protein